MITFLNWLFGAIIGAGLYLSFDKIEVTTPLLAMLVVVTIVIAIFECLWARSYLQICGLALVQGYILWSPSAAVIADFTNFFRPEETITWPDFVSLRSSLAFLGWLGYLMGGAAIFFFRILQVRVSDQTFPIFPDWQWLQPWLIRFRLV